MKLQLKDFNDKHLGETIYIIGCAPSINNLTKENIGKSYFDKSIKGDLVAITFQNMNQGKLTGNVDIC